MASLSGSLFFIAWVEFISLILSHPGRPLSRRDCKIILTPRLSYTTLIVCIILFLFYTSRERNRVPDLACNIIGDSWARRKNLRLVKKQITYWASILKEFYLFCNKAHCFLFLSKGTLNSNNYFWQILINVFAGVNPNICSS